MENTKIYEDIAQRTAGDIYIGVVGPVRTGKSTFIKRFMETLVLPNIDNVYVKERARDELPQSGSGRTVMTAEPKFVPEDGVEITLTNTAAFTVRLIDCVGYMVDGAIGLSEDGMPRMVTTPWYEHEIPMSEAAEIGTRKVISDHSTIGIVITTDGSITDIDREAYLDAEERVICELKEIGKPFLVLVNSALPYSEKAMRIRDDISRRHGVSCMTVNCLELKEQDITNIIKTVLYEFPLSEMGVFLPPWVEALPAGHPLKCGLYENIKTSSENIYRIRDVGNAVNEMAMQESIESAILLEVNLGNGLVTARLELPRGLFYDTLSERSGFAVRDDGDLMSLLSEMSGIKTDYDRIKDALEDVKTKGYGIVMPTMEELKLEEPEIVRRGGKYCVRLKASAPSIHMIKANIETEVSPAVGGEHSSEDMINYLLQAFEGDTSKIWSSNLFGRSLNEIAGEGLYSKIKKMPEDAQGKLQETLQRIINEGSGGLICIIL
jgi:stage IV sporulation protein A